MSVYERVHQHTYTHVIVKTVLNRTKSQVPESLTVGIYSRTMDPIINNRKRSLYCMKVSLPLVMRLGKKTPKCLFYYLLGILGVGPCGLDFLCMEWDDGLRTGLVCGEWDKCFFFVFLKMIMITTNRRFVGTYQLHKSFIIHILPTFLASLH